MARRRGIFDILLLVLLSVLSWASAQDSPDLSGSVSGSVSTSESAVDISNQNRCSFRGNFLLHTQSTRLDPCTVCTCFNRTTTCNIESCPSEAGCEVSEIVVIPEECCLQCPYKMFVDQTTNLYDQTFEFSEGDSKSVKFNLDIAVDRKLTSRKVRGDNLWKLSAWISSNEDGSGRKYSFKRNIFTENQTAQEYSKPNYPPWVWDKLKYTMKFKGGTCPDYKFFCVKFDQADDPRQTYDLSFTFQPVDNEEERLIDCIPLGECKAFTATNLDWELTEVDDPLYGHDTAISLNVDVDFTLDSPRKLQGEGLWRVGIFGSENPDGDGTRFAEVRQTLNENKASTTKKGRSLKIVVISSECPLFFQLYITAIGCGDVQYVCVEFARGDSPNPDFTMTVDTGRGDTSSDTLITCKEQGRSAFDISNQNRCSFRGNFLLHKQSTRLDPCTVCICFNGTTTCDIESCPSEAGCEAHEIVVIPEECCPQCPYKMFVDQTTNLYNQTFEFSEGDSKSVKFNLDIAVDSKLTSRIVRGENLWKLSAWISSNEDGSGRKYSFEDNIFTKKHAGQEYSKPNYPPWVWDKLKYTMKFKGGTCPDYKFFCVKFDQGDDPQPTYDLSFTFQPVDNEEERLIDCIPLGECKAFTATSLDWELTEVDDPLYGRDTAINLNVDVVFTLDSPRKLQGEGLWRVGIFGSENPDGDGTRFAEVRQTLNENKASTTKKGRSLKIDVISSECPLFFQLYITAIGCGDVQYVCVEFARGDSPDPDFTMTVDTDRGDTSSDTLITCKEQGSSASEYPFN